MIRRVNDGSVTGLKQDRFRHSHFEYSENQHQIYGMFHKTPNTIGGPYEENRGRRGDEDWPHSREENPFENGKVHNWSHKEGWDQYYERPRSRQGGALRPESETHFGKGPKGYTRSDESIYEDICEVLFLSRDVDASDIEVSVKNGLATLKGNVQDRTMKKMAALEIENISGVKDVQNLLTLKA